MLLEIRGHVVHHSQFMNYYIIFVNYYADRTNLHVIPLYGAIANITEIRENIGKGKEKSLYTKQRYRPCNSQ